MAVRLNEIKEKIIYLYYKCSYENENKWFLVWGITLNIINFQKNANMQEALKMIRSHLSWVIKHVFLL